MSTFPNIASWLPVALLMAGCGESPVAQGGSGTDAGNALTVLARAHDGSAAKGAMVQIWPADQVPELAGTAPSYKGTTDSSGEARFALPTGTWSVLVRMGGTSCWKLSPHAGRVTDTLEPIGKATGLLRGGAGFAVSAVGLGMTAICDASGYFQLDSLPAGTFSVVLAKAGKTSTTTFALAPGETASLASSFDSIPARLDGSVPDTLSLPSALPATVARSALGDTGGFAIGAQLHRTDSSTRSVIFSWTDLTGAKLRLSWTGYDSMELVLNGVPTIVAGIPLGGGTHQVGMLWTGENLEVYLDQELLLSSNNSILADRTGWKDAVVGESGIAKVDWIVFRKGIAPSDWFAHLP